MTSLPESKISQVPQQGTDGPQGFDAIWYEWFEPYGGATWLPIVGAVLVAALLWWLFRRARRRS